MSEYMIHDCKYMSSYNIYSYGNPLETNTIATYSFVYSLRNSIAYTISGSSVIFEKYDISGTH